MDLTVNSPNVIEAIGKLLIFGKKPKLFPTAIETQPKVGFYVLKLSS